MHPFVKAYCEKWRYTLVEEASIFAAEIFCKKKCTHKQRMSNICSFVNGSGKVGKLVGGIQDE